jgi:hypothetical protein
MVFFDSDGLSDGSIPSAVLWLGKAGPGVARLVLAVFGRSRRGMARDYL